ncbi:MAG: DUF5777 family beta-barrel protein [Bacteroidales bacterium]
MKKIFIFLTGIIMLTSLVKSQEPVNIFNSTRTGLVQSADPVGKGELQFILSHRFGDLGGGLYDMFGLDLATMRFGFDYGIANRTTIGAGRSTFEKTYDLFLKHQLLVQSSGGSPVALTIDVSTSIATQKNIYPVDNDGFFDRSSYSFQMIAARRFKKLSLQVSPTLFINNFETRTSGSLSLFAIPVAASLKLTKRLSFASQYIPSFNKPEFAGANPFSAGIEIDTGGPQFQLLFTNNTGMFDKAILTNTTGDWKKGKIYFGFNLVRVFYLKQQN